jgi:hypothetical protein
MVWGNEIPTALVTYPRCIDALSPADIASLRHSAACHARYIYNDRERENHGDYQRASDIGPIHF